MRWLQIAIPTVLGAILAGFIAVQLSGHSWLWTGALVGAVVGFTISKWEHFFLNEVLGWSKWNRWKMNDGADPEV